MKRFPFIHRLMIFFTSGFLMLTNNAISGNGVCRTDKPEEPTENPSLMNLELIGETFFKQGISSGRNFMGLAAIMLQGEGSLSPQLSFKGTVGFDSSLWQDFINTPAASRYQPHSQAELTPAVEEFMINWSTKQGVFTISAGRMLSEVNYASHRNSADSYFNLNPRIFTEYWGDNGGLALDGLRGQWHLSGNDLSGTLIVEAAKSGYDSEQLILNTILDLGMRVESFDIGTRWFGYFDHQEHDHPSLKWANFIHPDDLLCEGMGLNAWGAAINASWKNNSEEKAIFQLQYMNRNLGETSMTGSYAFMIWNFNQRVSTSLMLQFLERPVFSEDSLKILDEQGVTLGMTYMPLTDHRLCLEYNYFENSSFYKNMIVIKWDFSIPL